MDGYWHRDEYLKNFIQGPNLIPLCNTTACGPGRKCAQPSYYDSRHTDSPGTSRKYVTGIRSAQIVRLSSIALKSYLVATEGDPGKILFDSRYHLQSSLLSTAFDKSNLRLHGNRCHQKLIKITV